MSVLEQQVSDLQDNLAAQPFTAHKLQMMSAYHEFVLYFRAHSAELIIHPTDQKEGQSN